MTNELFNKSNIFNITDVGFCNIIANNRNINSDSIDDKFSITSTKKTNSNKNSENANNININIYRYKFTDEFTKELFNFSKIHQYDCRKEFKEAWNNWVTENNNIVNEEVQRLTNLGYDGDVLDKMFKSARYYFRKKNITKNAQSERRIYTGVQKELLTEMDNHIMSNINKKNYKPSDGFKDFCEINKNLLNNEINTLQNNGLTNFEEINTKIKKTYKNRYYLFISK